MEPKIDYKTLTDIELVEHIIINKKTQLFGILYDRYIKAVYNKCYGFCSSEAETKDLTQDVFLHIFVKLHKFETKVSFKSWLYVITYNYCVNYVNRNNNKKIEKVSVELDDANELLIEVSDHSLFDLKVEKLTKALEIIPVEDKIILLLKYQDDIPLKELVSILNLGESAVKMRLKRAKSKVIKAYNAL